MSAVKPKAPVRRFDVFAEYNRLKARHEGQSAAQAKGYGLWVAKVVAAKKFRKKEKETPSEGKSEKPIRKTKWHELSGIPQTDKLFDKEIISRMGRDFYRQVFAPAIQKAFEQGTEYREIRDSIRLAWKPDRK
jgi:hypothetical protein